MGVFFVTTVLHRKRKTKAPCPKCFLHKNLCICELIPKLNLSTRLILVVHAKELKRTTNTGRLALLALENSKMFVRGSEHSRLDLSSILTEDFDSLLFYPCEEAMELESYLRTREVGSAGAQKPIQLIVPDGNWRQASKVAIRHPELKNLQRVQITSANLAAQHLRKEHFPEGLSTLEAIALAYEAIEGPLVGQQLKDIYRAKLNATLKGRGGG